MNEQLFTLLEKCSRGGRGGDHAEDWLPHSCEVIFARIWSLGRRIKVIDYVLSIGYLSEFAHRLFLPELDP